MGITELTHLIPPPISPYESGSAREWGRVETSIGTPLPKDYKSFVNLYGSGLLCEYIYVLNPFSERDKLNLFKRSNRILQDRRTIREEFGLEAWPYALYPERGGLFPFGGTENGDILYWATNGEPLQWSIVVNEVRSRNFEEFSSSMTDFFVEVITGRTRSNIIGKLKIKKPFTII